MIWTLQQFGSERHGSLLYFSIFLSCFSFVLVKISIFAAKKLARKSWRENFALFLSKWTTYKT